MEGRRGTWISEAGEVRRLWTVVMEVRVELRKRKVSDKGDEVS